MQTTSLESGSCQLLNHKKKKKKKKKIWEEVSTVLLPALVTTDHVAVVVGEATDAAGDVSPVAAIL